MPPYNFMGVWNWIVKLAEPPKENNWRVIYDDGQRSRPMCKRIAKDYAKMFNGSIELTHDPIYDLGLRGP